MYKSRGVLILEEGLKALESPLKSRNFRVHRIAFDSTSVDAADQDVYQMLMHRVLVTDHSKDFLEAAAIHEFGIIDTAQATKDPEELADIISSEGFVSSLRGRGPSIAQVGADGSVAVKEIED
jgi:hypothetical protein